MAIRFQGKETYAGKVIATYEQNMPDDSDFFAIVWNDEFQTLDRIMFDTTRMGGGGDAERDATDEVMEKARKYLWNFSHNNTLERAEKDAKKVEKGDPAIVLIPPIKGKNKCEIGTRGEIIWKGFVRAYGSKNDIERVGLKTSENRVIWLDSYRVAHADWENRIPDFEELIDRTNYALRNAHGIMNEYLKLQKEKGNK